MSDQAEVLRKRLNQMHNPGFIKTIAVISGKGGVGKSNISLNFSLSLCNKGKRVLLFDMDIGMGNIDILLGMPGQRTIVNLFEDGMTIHDIMQKGPQNLTYIAGGTGLSSLFTLDYQKSHYFLEQLHSILPDYDYVIFDMGAGISQESLDFLLTVDEIFVVTTPEPTSITDAYSAMKYICLADRNIPLYIIVNRALTEQEGNRTLNRLTQAVTNFLNKDATQLGVLPDDKSVVRAVSQQIPFLFYAPKSNISKAIETLTKNYLTINEGVTTTGPMSFISKLRRFFIDKRVR